MRWSLARKLRTAGFEAISITPFDWLHPATPKPLIGLVLMAGKLAEAIPAVREFSGSVYINARLPLGDRSPQT